MKADRPVGARASPRHFAALRAPGISPKVLAEQLRELGGDGIVLPVLAIQARVATIGPP